MRDKERIPKVIKELERIWNANPDFRLGQLLVVAARPENPCPDVFYMEDAAILKGLLAFDNKKEVKPSKARQLTNWQKYPDVSRIKPEEITIDLIREMINAVKTQKKGIVITPISLMMLNGAPISDNNWILNQKLRIKKIKKFLAQLNEEGLLEKRELKQGFKGMREVGYNFI